MLILMVYLLPQGGFMLSFQMPWSVADWLPGRELEIKQVPAELEIKDRERRIVA